MNGMNGRSFEQTSMMSRRTGLPSETPVQQSNFVGLGWGIALGAAVGGYLGYQAGKSDEFRAKMAWYRQEYCNRMSEWYKRQSETWIKRYQNWNEKNSGIVEA